METIKFKSHGRYWNDDGTCRLAEPIPAKTKIPDWFKTLGRQCPADDAGPSEQTVKMCPPFLEAMVHGYVIPAPFDFQLDFQQTNDGKHQIVQDLSADIGDVDRDHWNPVLSYRLGAPLKPMVMYCRSFWQIHTPPGFSSLVVEPFNHNIDELPFKVLSQLVESDRDHTDLVLSLVPRKPFPIAVKKGTPLAQVLPFGREEWNLERVGLGKEVIDDISNFRDAYWSCENREFDEGADTTDPQQGYGAFHKLVKVQTRFQ